MGTPPCLMSKVYQIPGFWQIFPNIFDISYLYIFSNTERIYSPKQF